MNLNIAKSFVLAALASVALAATAAGQKSEPPPIAGEATLGVTVAETAVIATGWRASKLMHAAVYNENNEKIGKIDDFIVSPDGKLTAAVVDVGGFLRLGAHRVAIPVQQFDQVSPKLVLKGATKEALLKMPEFRYAA
jgi:sporulation protein YlmC with PRC-barrel domain